VGQQITTQRTEVPAVPGRTLATIRVYRTAGGQLVADGDPRAAFLAYPVGEPIADADAAAYEQLVAPAPRRTTKAAPKPTDKAASKPGDK